MLLLNVIEVAKATTTIVTLPVKVTILISRTILQLYNYNLLSRNLFLKTMMMNPGTTNLCPSPLPVMMSLHRKRKRIRIRMWKFRNFLFQVCQNGQESCQPAVPPVVQVVPFRNWAQGKVLSIMISQIFKKRFYCYFQHFNFTNFKIFPIPLSSHLDDLPRVRISVVQANAAEVVMPEREQEE